MHTRAFNSLFSFSVLCTILLSLLSANAHAESGTGPSNHIEPQRGEVMASVESRLGPPIEKFSAVGTPPIVRWVYKDFTVYFESNYVIHSTNNSIKPPKRP